ncbi:MAG: DinB family protein [Bacteroidota bacterium]
MSWSPSPEEYAPYYANYVRFVEGQNSLHVLRQQLEGFTAKLAKLTEAQWNYRYEADKWSVKEIVGHLTDTERVFAYRALRFSRGDTTALPGFDQDQFIANAQFDRLSPDLIMRDWQYTRMSTVSLRYGLADEVASLAGEASGHKMSVRALFAVTAGHTIHHIKVMRERYELDL